MSQKEPSIVPADRIVVLIPAKLTDVSIPVNPISVVEKDQPEIGEVISVGKSGWFDNGRPKVMPLDMKAGDIVAYRKYGESKFWIGGKQFVFVQADDVLAVLKKK